MDILGNKFFSYIEKANELTQDMINQYNSSLIFLGDEKQIFVPVINTYVGLGQTAYSYILNKFELTDINFSEYDKYIHNDTVTSIYAQFSPEELLEAMRQANNHQIVIRNKSINEEPIAYTTFKANKNIVIKGLNQYNDFNNTVDESVHSGVDINIKHAGSVQRGTYKFNGKEYSYTYYNPYDVITVDDTKTWSYITSSNTYIVDFVTKFATQQANRVYKNLLGEDDSYIEKQFDEAFHYDNVTGQLIEYEDVYVKWYNAAYKPIKVINTDNGYRIQVIGEVDPDTNEEYIIYSTISGDTIATLEDILAGPNSTSNQKGAKYGGYWTDTNNNIYPIWYHLENTGKSTIDIVDGIQTLKEVAYVLDRITDGTDTGNDGISIAYNIAQNYRDIKELQAWRDQIGDETVSSFKSTSNTDLLTVAYYSVDKWNINDDKAVGHVKLDLNLTLAQTYVLDGITYAAYLTNNQVPDDQITYFIKHDDITSFKNYISLCTDDPQKVNTSYTDLINIICEQNPLIDPLTDHVSILSIRDVNGELIIENTGSVLVSDLIYLDSQDQANLDKYIYFPYTKSNYIFDKGLTDINWVTTYVGWTSYNILYKVDQINQSLSQEISDAIDSLDYNDEDNSSIGEFVTKVDEENGVISVTRQKLPLDHILKNDINTTAEVYIHTSVANAKTLILNNSVVFINDGTGYMQIDNMTTFNNISEGRDDNDYTLFYIKKPLADMNPVPVDTTVNELLTNAGNATYFYKDNSTGITRYLPLDIQSENKNGGLLEEAKVAESDTIYYLNKSTFINTKYFDVNTIHQRNGSTTTLFTSYITYLAAASEISTGLADAWDVRRSIESLFKWVNIKTNTIIE